jgi:hypothetical protein
MVDMNTYKRMNHPKLPNPKSLEDDLPPGAFDEDDPPGGDFTLLLPMGISAFYMQDKRWRESHDMLVCL